MEPQRLFDTEIAARLLGLKRFGLAAVTEHFLGLTLAKEHSAADWSYRPLPRDWRNYAALDVELLIELETKMRAELKRQGKDGMGSGRVRLRARVLDHARSIRFPGCMSRTSPKSFVTGRRWPSPARYGTRRDELAREYDIAPSLLLSDSSIIEVAKRKPHNAAQFRSIRSILNERVRIHTDSEQDKMFERYAPIQRKIKPSMWKNIIQDALALPPSQWPDVDGGAARRHESQSASAPKSIRVWKGTVSGTSASAQQGAQGVSPR